MKQLHTISKSPDSQLLDQCLAVCSRGDAILFIEDGVYHGVQGQQLAKIPVKIPVYGLREDLLARGLLDRHQAPMKAASTRKFVELCCHYDKVVSWF